MSSNFCWVNSPSRFLSHAAGAKRARQIVDAGESQLDYVDGLPSAKCAKPVGVALEEILNDVVDFELKEQ